MANLKDGTLTMLTIVRAVGFVEGISAMLLFFVAMPLKYMADIPKPVSIVGSIHGVLWLGYGIVVIAAWAYGKLPGRWVWILGAASIIPFGPFLADRRLASIERNAKATEAQDGV